jgi:hypothetical protein
MDARTLLPATLILKRPMMTILVSIRTMMEIAVNSMDVLILTLAISTQKLIVKIFSPVITVARVVWMIRPVTTTRVQQRTMVTAATMFV